ALWVLARFPDSQVVAFDIEQRMLGMLSRRAERLGEQRRRLIVAHGDLRVPEILTRLDSGQALAMAEQSFDAVVVGAALEHAPLHATLERLTRLLRPGGVFLNLGVRPGPAVAVLEHLYRFRSYAPNEILQSLRRLGFVDVRVLRLM